MAVLDTSFLIDLHAGLPAADRTLKELEAEDEALLVPAIAASEYMAGVPLDRRLTAWHGLDETFTIVHTDDFQVLETARLAQSALKEGRFPGWTDAQIAALAMYHVTYVVTANVRHFQALGCGWWDYRAADGPQPPD